MSWGLKTAVIYAIKERLSPVPAGVCANRHPEAAGAPERGGREKTEANNGNNADLGLARIAHVGAGKHKGGDDSGRPKTKPVSEGVLSVSPEKKFFKQAYKEKNHPP